MEGEHEPAIQDCTRVYHKLPWLHFLCISAFDAGAIHTTLNMGRPLAGWKPWVVNAFLAMTITDCFEFIRLPLIVATTPRLSRMVRQWRGR